MKGIVEVSVIGVSHLPPHMLRSGALTGLGSGLGLAGHSSSGRHSPLFAQGISGVGHCPRGALGYVPETVGHGLPSAGPRSRKSSPVAVRGVGPQMARAPIAEADEVEETGGVVWGHDFGERFSMGEVIGEGQQGVVRDVVQRDTGDVLAVKILLKDIAGDLANGSGEKKMRSEANFLKGLQGCPVVARLQGAYEDEEHVYIVMERLDGGSIEDKLEKVGRFEELEAGELMRAVIGFLAHSHKRGVCYGDVKPANFMLGSSCHKCLEPCTAGRLKGLTVKAVDFGCCQRTVPGVPFRRRSGSPLYMAPEVFLGRYGIEADLWSAGVMLHQLLSGKMPFAEYDEDGEIIEVGLHLGYSFDDEPWGSVSSEVKDLIAQLLVRAPMKRISAEQALKHPWFTEVVHRLQERDMGQEASSIVTAPGNLPIAPSVTSAVV